MIHLARTPDEKTDASSEASYTSEKPLRSLISISETWVADHAKHVTRMLPGGMFVQGLY